MRSDATQARAATLPLAYAPLSRDQSTVWPPFVQAAILLALTGGFGLGGALFLVTAAGFPAGPWWPAAARAHGHLQLYGWAGLMVLGVGLHVLPRLRGAPLVRPAWTRLALALLLTGLLLRLLSQPALALAPAGRFTSILRASLIGSGVLEVSGVSLALALLARTARHGPALSERAGFRQVLPFLLTAFGALWLAHALNLAGLIALAGGVTTTGYRLNSLALALALHGFLLPICIGMSARLFPLHFQTVLPRIGLLRLGLAGGLGGLALRVIDTIIGQPPLAAAGQIAQAGALALYVLGLGVFARRRPLPRPPAHPPTNPLHLHVLSANLWLLGAAVVLAWAAVAATGAVAPPPALETHLLGAGYVTHLILGLGAVLLPGFARRPLRGQWLCWLTLVLGNVAVLLRVGPPLLPAGVPVGLRAALLALSGVAGVGAIALFALNLRGAPPPRRHANAERTSPPGIRETRGGG